MRGGLILLSLFMSLPLSAAELIVKAPLRVLAVSPQQSISGSNLTLGPGEHQLLVRYEGVLPARSNSESDIEVTSDPQVLHVLVKGDETLTLSAPQLNSESAMEQYVKAPTMTLSGSAYPEQSLRQQPIALKGFVLGIDYQDLLADHLRDEAAATAGQTAAASQVATASTVAATAAVTAAATAAPATSTVAVADITAAAQSREQALQQLFLQSTPEERKRFIGWAVQQF
jgi:uncharacterized protein YccT (UPF0319 family)